MLGRHVLAPLRGLVLFGLSLVGLAQVVVAVTLSFTGVVRHLEYERWLPDLSRRLVRSWLGIEVARPYRPKPVLPAPEPDGLYRHGNQLYKRAWSLRYRMRYRWLQHDPATHRDHVWALLTPITGGLAAGLPALLVVAGFLLPVWATIPLVVAGFVIGPASLRAYGVWSAAMLGPVRLRLWDGVWRQATGCVLLARTFVMSLVSFPRMLLMTVSVDPLVLRKWPQFIEEFRWLVNVRRRRISEWSGVRIDVPYLPPPPPPVPRPDGRYRSGKRLYDEPEPLIRTQFRRATYQDKATWRDLLWLLLDPVVALVLAAVPVLLGVGAFVVYFWSWVLALPVSLFSSRDPRAGWAYLNLVPGLEWVPRWGTPLAGLAVPLLVLLASRPLLTAYGRWGRLLLGPTRSAVLARRVATLTETRADAIDTQAAELRRIERDLHDGAQARWVAMGLQLGAVERLIDEDPERAKKLLVSARSASAEALAELRGLVRGIHPPVLSERGLGDAVRALALDSALDVHVTVDLTGRANAPIEAAVYFAVSELLTNVGKHAHATRASIDIRHHNDRLRVTVTDDGRGGASPVAGGGLDGVRRRIATFDGVLVLHSPPGGPTTATLELPCALSSPRTSTSSETA